MNVRYVVTERKVAEVKYKKALENLKKAEDISEEAWKAANDSLDVARKELVEMEIKHPTTKELKKQNRTIFLRNIGIEQ